MADLSRRLFLRGALSVAATTALIRPSALLAAAPKIVADGLHNDGPGLNALFGGRPVDIVNDAVRILRGKQIEISGGVYKVGERLRVTQDYTYIHGGSFIFSGESFGFFLEGKHCFIIGNRLDVLNPDNKGPWLTIA